MTTFASCTPDNLPRFPADTVIYDLAGVTGAATQTGINAGLSMFTWFCQISAVLAGKKVGRRPFLLGVWPLLLICLAGVCAAL
jgi:SP family sugar:H+ symporter-like MFS transporter